MFGLLIAFDFKRRRATIIAQVMESAGWSIVSMTNRAVYCTKKTGQGDSKISPANDGSYMALLPVAPAMPFWAQISHIVYREQ